MRYEKTANRIREAMADMGMTQQELADMSKLGKSSISHYVNGSNEPGNKSAYALAEVLNVNPAWLMGLDAPKESLKTIEGNLVKARLDFLEIDPDNESALKDNAELFYKLKEKYNVISADAGTGKSDTIAKALDFLERYENANPEVQAAIRTLLKVPQ